MATTLSNSTTYTGKDTDGFFTTALLTGASKESFRLIPNVKSSVKLGSLNLGNILADDSCTFEATGTITLAQKTLSVCDLKVNIELCEKDYEPLYLSEQLKAGSNVDGNIPASFNDFLLTLIANRISQQTEVICWQGDASASPVTLCDGINKLLLADSTVIDVAVDGTKLTTVSATAGVIQEIGRIYAAIPSTVDIAKARCYVSIATARAYKQSLVAANPALVGFNQGDYKLTYIDLEMIIAPGMPNLKAVCADPDNLWYGTDLVSDERELNIISMKNILGQPTVRFITEFKIGFQIGVGAEIVYYN